MDKETGKLDLSRWVIVHDSPTLAWIGELHDPAYWLVLDNNGQPLDGPCGELRPALVLQTVLAQGPGGMGMLTHITPPHGLASPLALNLTTEGRTITLVRWLAEGDQDDLRAKIQATLQGMLEHRARQSGIVTPVRR